MAVIIVMDILKNIMEFRAVDSQIITGIVSFKAVNVGVEFFAHKTALGFNYSVVGVGSQIKNMKIQVVLFACLGEVLQIQIIFIGDNRNHA